MSYSSSNNILSIFFQFNEQVSYKSISCFIKPLTKSFLIQYTEITHQRGVLLRGNTFNLKCSKVYQICRAKLQHHTKFFKIGVKNRAAANGGIETDGKICFQVPSATKMCGKLLKARSVVSVKLLVQHVKVRALSAESLWAHEARNSGSRAKAFTGRRRFALLASELFVGKFSGM